MFGANNQVHRGQMVEFDVQQVVIEGLHIGGLSLMNQ
jgi:hypothetical protein